jgi:hypothetical protein
MAIVLNPMQRDMFGGPAGGTQKTTDRLVQSILAGIEKRKQDNQDSLLTSLFQEHSALGDPDAFLQTVLNNQQLTPQSKQRGVQMAASLGQIDNLQARNRLRTAQADALENPPPEKPDLVEIKYWKKGDPNSGSSLMVPKTAYNSVVAKLEAGGHSVSAPEKPEKRTKTEVEKVLDAIDANKDKPERVAALKKELNRKLENPKKEDMTDKIELDDGTLMTLGELRRQYFAYNGLDETELMSMEFSGDPRQVARAKQLRAELAKTMSLVDFYQEAKRWGLKGLRDEMAVRKKKMARHRANPQPAYRKPDAATGKADAIRLPEGDGWELVQQ